MHISQRNKHFLFESRTTFSAILRPSRYKPVVNTEVNQSTRRKPPPNLKSLATFPHAQAGYSNAGSGERQAAVIGNTFSTDLNLLPIMLHSLQNDYYKAPK